MATDKEMYPCPKLVFHHYSYFTKLNEYFHLKCFVDGKYLLIVCLLFMWNDMLHCKVHKPCKGNWAASSFPATRMPCLWAVGHWDFKTSPGGADYPWTGQTSCVTFLKPSHPYPSRTANYQSLCFQPHCARLSVLTYLFLKTVVFDSRLCDIPLSL